MAYRTVAYNTPPSPLPKKTKNNYSTLSWLSLNKIQFYSEDRALTVLYSTAILNLQKTKW